MPWADLLTYQLADFVPYDATAWQRLYQQYLAQNVVGAIAIASLVLAGLLLTLRRFPVRTALTALLFALAAAWAWLGIRFHGQWHAQLNWAAHYWTGLFVLQGVLLCLGALLVQFRPANWRWRFSRTARLTMLVPWLLPPLAGLLFSDRGWSALQTVGFAPDPTAWFTMLLLSQLAPVKDAIRDEVATRCLMTALALVIAILAALSLVFSAAAAWVTGATDLLLVSTLALASTLVVVLARVVASWRADRAV